MFVIACVETLADIDYIEATKRDILLNIMIGFTQILDYVWKMVKAKNYIDLIMSKTVTDGCQALIRSQIKSMLISAILDNGPKISHHPTYCLESL